MIVSFIEEDRIREQLKNLMEDDEKRRKGYMGVLRRDKQLANSEMSFKDATNTFASNRTVVNRFSLLKMSPKNTGVYLDKATHPLPFKQKANSNAFTLKPSSTIDNLNATLEAYGSRVKTNINGNNKKSATRLSPLIGDPSSKSTSKSKLARKTIPRSETNINKTVSASPASTAKEPLNKNKNMSNNNSSSSKLLKPLISNAKTKLDKASSPIPTTSSYVNKKKDKILIKVSNASTSKTPLTNPVLITKTPLTPSDKQSMLPQKNSKLLKTTKTTNMNKTDPKISKNISKLIQSVQSNGTTQESKTPKKYSKPLSGNSRQKLATIPYKSKPHTSNDSSKTPLTLSEKQSILAKKNSKFLKTNKTTNVNKTDTKSKSIPHASNDSRKSREDFTSTLTQIGTVKALVEKIATLSKSNSESAKSKMPITHRSTDKKNVSSKKEALQKDIHKGQSVKKAKEWREESTTSESQAEELKTSEEDSSDFNISPEDVREIIMQQKEKKKTKLDPYYYSMKGFFGARNEGVVALSSFDDDDDGSDSDTESLEFSDSESSSQYTLQDNSDIPSDDLSLSIELDDDTNDTNDPDYELPPDEVEDLVIHKGSAPIRDIKCDENKVFDSDDDESKIVEIPQKSRPVKTVRQPKSTSKEELMKLTVYTSAASSSQIRKRHLALKSEDNDLPSQKSLQKLNFEEGEEEDEVELKPAKIKKNSKSKIDLTAVESKSRQKQIPANASNETSAAKVTTPTTTNTTNTTNSTKSQDTMKPSESKLSKSDSCPLLKDFGSTNRDSEFGIPTIQSAAPKFDIFKSQSAIECHDINGFKSYEDLDEDSCPQLVAIDDSNEPCNKENDDKPHKHSKDGQCCNHTDSDMDSIISVDVNQKYLYTFDDILDTTDDEMLDIPIAVIDATKCSYDAPKNVPEIKEDEDMNQYVSPTNSTAILEIDSNEVSSLSDEANCQDSVETSTQQQSQSNSQSNNDLITFNDNEAMINLQDNNPDSVATHQDYVNNLVNNNQKQCIMYAIQTTQPLTRDKLGQTDFQFVNYVPVEEQRAASSNNNQQRGNTRQTVYQDSNRLTRQLPSAKEDSSDSDEEEDSDQKTNKTGFNATTEKVPKTIANTFPKIQRREYLNEHINSLVSRKVLMLLRSPFYIYGTVKLTVLVGSVEVLGYKATAGDTLEIFSPKGFSLLQVLPLYSEEAVDYEEDFIRESLAKVEEHFTTLDLRKMRRLYVPKTDAIIVLDRNDERLKLTMNFKLFMNENVFPKIKSFNSKPPFGGSEHLLKCRILPDTDQALKIPLNWLNFSLYPNSRVVVAGGKGVGKSTFVRYVINKHLSLHPKILLIDLDIGQPEIFVPQTVSYTVIKKPLIGPGFFLNKQPHKAYVVGHTNVVMCPMVYKNAIKSLIKECHINDYLKEIPWVVNTMGYNKGFAAELMAMIVELIQPTDVVQINSSREINNFDIQLDSVSLSTQMPRFIDDLRPAAERREIIPYVLHKFDSVSGQGTHQSKEWVMSSKDMRYAMLIARLSDALYGEAQMLTDCKPIWINFNKIKLYNAVTDYQNKSELLRAIEGNLVYLGSYVDESHPIECYGIGVVRALDFQTERIYFVPAMPYEYMFYVNCLVIGEMSLPTTMLKNQGYKITNNVPFVFETDDSKASRAIKQIFHRPSEFFIGSKHSFDV